MNPSKLKILHAVEFYYPSIGGMQEVVKQLSERLVLLGHDVTVVTSYLPSRQEKEVLGVKIKEFKVSGNLTVGISGEVEAYQEFLTKSDFDVIVTFASHQWTTDAALPVLKDIRAKKVFVTTWAFPPSYATYIQKTKESLLNYDSLVYLADNPTDLVFAKEQGLEKITVIPNGADEREFETAQEENGSKLRAKLGIPENNTLLLHIGSHTGKKGHKEAVEIFKKANLPNATLLIVGNHFGIRGCTLSCSLKGVFSKIFLPKNKQLLITSLSREEVLSAYAAADLFFFPSNIECQPIVLFEAAASRTPFLTTDVAFTSDIVRWTRGGLLLPTHKYPNGHVRALIPESTKMLDGLLKDRAQMQQLGESGFKNWQEKFTWQQIAKQYEALYKSL